MDNIKGADGGLCELALFAGAGGGILGGHLLGWRTVCAVEYEPYAAGVLIARQNEGILPPFPIWDDVRTFDGKPWRGVAEVVSGGFPCQDISSAGKGAGIDGERSGLWGEMARIIGEVRPRFAFVENSPILTSRGLGRVLGDLAALGYDAEWCVLGAADVGAPHKRDRIWILATDASSATDGQQYTLEENRGDRYVAGEELAHANKAQCKGNKCPERGYQERADIGKPSWWQTEPDVGRVANGVAARVDRLSAIGNGQVPAVAATAFRLLHDRLRGLDKRGPIA